MSSTTDSVLAIAMDLGTSSPSTTCKSVTNMNAITEAMECTKMGEDSTKK